MFSFLAQEGHVWSHLDPVNCLEATGKIWFIPRLLLRPAEAAATCNCHLYRKITAAQEDTWDTHMFQAVAPFLPLHISLPTASRGQLQTQWNRNTHSTPIGEGEVCYLLHNNLSLLCKRWLSWLVLMEREACGICLCVIGIKGHWQSEVCPQICRLNSSTLSVQQGWIRRSVTQLAWDKWTQQDASLLTLKELPIFAK